MKRLFALLIALLLLGGCAGEGDYTPTGDGLSWDEDYTGPVATRPQEQKGEDIALPCYQEITINPIQCTDDTNRAFSSLLYQGLFTVDRNYSVEPMLCGKYSMSGDMKQYVFYVDQAATFSDGSQVTAADVHACLLAAKDSAYYGGRFLHIKTVELTEDGGVSVSLDTACENLPILLDIPIIPQEQLESERPIGSGPYTLDTTGSNWVLRRRTNWWCSGEIAPNADTIVLAKAQSATQIRDDFQFADLNLVVTNPCSDKYTDYRSDYELWDFESGAFTYIAFSGSSPVFDTPEFRAALTYVVDRDTLAEDYYRGFGKSATLPASPMSPYYNKALADRYTYDPEKFRTVVQELGKEGQEVRFLVNSEDSLRLRAARVIADEMTRAGLVVTMIERSGDEYVSAIRNRVFDIYMGQTKLSANMDLTAFFHARGALSLGGVDDTQAYALCLQALENHGNYYTLHQNIMDRGLLCPVLFCAKGVYAARGAVTDLSPSRDNLSFYSIGKTMESAFIRSAE